MVAKSSLSNRAPRFWRHSEKSSHRSSGFSLTFRKVALEPQGSASLEKKVALNPEGLALRHSSKAFPPAIPSGYGLQFVFA